LEEAEGDVKKPPEILRKRVFDKALSKRSREVKAGLVDSYIHSTGRIGALVTVACETDFVSRLDEFKELAHNVAMQVAAMDPASVDELLEQPSSRTPRRTIKDLVTEVIAKTKGEHQNPRIKRFQV